MLPVYKNKSSEDSNQVYSVAPGEGSKLIPLLTDEHIEELENSDKFLSGTGEFTSTKRTVNMILSKSINACLLD